MSASFDHERLKAYQAALRFVAWVGPIIEALPTKLAVRDQLDRASTSIALNLAEGNGKRSRPDRCRYFDIARGSTVECAACLDVLVRRNLLVAAQVEEGKRILIDVVSMTAGLIARFSSELHEEQADYGSGLMEKEND
ncbi:MAG: four helix bundle protein [Opitutaceae bacterium]|nr:four helix bundle protein [Opitutaceae bacterium]